MKEYIEREALEKDFNSRLNDLVAEYGQYDPYTRGFDEAVDRLEDAPTADVVEVRCKDCRYYRAKNFPLFSGDCFYGVSGERTVFEDHYCSYGEWKMDKEE